MPKPTDIMDLDPTAIARAQEEIKYLRWCYQNSPIQVAAMRVAYVQDTGDPIPDGYE